MPRLRTSNIITMIHSVVVIGQVSPFSLYCITCKVWYEVNGIANSSTRFDREGARAENAIARVLLVQTTTSKQRCTYWESSLLWVHSEMAYGSVAHITIAKDTGRACPVLNQAWLPPTHLRTCPIFISPCHVGPAGALSHVFTSNLLLVIVLCLGVQSLS